MIGVEFSKKKKAENRPRSLGTLHRHGGSGGSATLGAFIIEKPESELNGDVPLRMPYPKT